MLIVLDMFVIELTIKEEYVRPKMDLFKKGVKLVKSVETVLRKLLIAYHALVNLYVVKVLSVIPIILDAAIPIKFTIPINVVPMIFVGLIVVINLQLNAQTVVNVVLLVMFMLMEESVNVVQILFVEIFVVEVVKFVPKILQEQMIYAVIKIKHVELALVLDAVAMYRNA
jgi:hypothetical protein